MEVAAIEDQMVRLHPCGDMCAEIDERVRVDVSGRGKLDPDESDVMRLLKALKAARAQQAPSAFTTNTPIQPSAIVIK